MDRGYYRFKVVETLLKKTNVGFNDTLAANEMNPNLKNCAVIGCYNGFGKDMNEEGLAPYAVQIEAHFKEVYNNTDPVIMTAIRPKPGKVVHMIQGHDFFGGDHDTIPLSL
eukprot:Awhi_evm1s14734